MTEHDWRHSPVFHSSAKWLLYIFWEDEKWRFTKLSVWPVRYWSDSRSNLEGWREETVLVDGESRPVVEVVDQRVPAPCSISSQVCVVLGIIGGHEREKWPGAPQTAHGVVHRSFMKNMAAIDQPSAWVMAHRLWLLTFHQVCANELLIIEKVEKRRTRKDDWTCAPGEQ